MKSEKKENSQKSFCSRLMLQAIEVVIKKQSELKFISECAINFAIFHKNNKQYQRVQIFWLQVWLSVVSEASRNRGFWV